MTEQHSDERTTIEPKSLHNNVILLHALYNLPIGPLMKNTYYIDGNLVFPLSRCRHANSLYQNYKRGRLPNQTYSIQTRIATLLEEFDLIISAFEDNEYLQFFISSVEANADNMPPHTSKATTRSPIKPLKYEDIEEDWDEEDVSVDDSFYNGDPVVPSGCSPVHSQGRSPPPPGGVLTTPLRRNHVAMVGFAPTIDSVQLYETAETNVNILGAYSWDKNASIT